MIALSPRRVQPAGATLGRFHGVLLLILGVTVLAVLLRATGGHRARLAAEVLGILLGGAASAIV